MESGEHKEIWLEPLEGRELGCEREWCQDKVWSEGVRYVLAQNDGWQPIETAPKDEKRVLLYSSDGVDIGAFNKWWNLDSGAWLRDQTAEYDNDGMVISPPTHWMPLPDPPTD